MTKFLTPFGPQQKSPDLPACTTTCEGLGKEQITYGYGTQILPGAECDLTNFWTINVVVGANRPVTNAHQVDLVR